MNDLAEELGLTKVPSVYLFHYQDNPRALKREHILLLDSLGTRTIIHPKYAYSWFMNNYMSLISHNHTPELNVLLEIAKKVTEIIIED